MNHGVHRVHGGLMDIGEIIIGAAMKVHTALFSPCPLR